MRSVNNSSLIQEAVYHLGHITKYTWEGVFAIKALRGETGNEYEPLYLSFQSLSRQGIFSLVMRKRRAHSGKMGKGDRRHTAQ